MRIGLLLPEINKGGAERAATRISKILAQDHEVYIIVFAQESKVAYDFAGKLVDLKVKSCRGLISKSLASLKRSHRLKKVKKQLKLDAVISFMQSPNFVNTHSKVKGCKCLVSIRNYIFTEKSTSFLAKLELRTTKSIVKKADKVICVSNEIKQEFKRKFSRLKDLEKKMEVLYNPYDIEEIKKLGAENYEKLDNTKFKFCSVGRIDYQKGFWNLVKSFYLFNQKYPNSELIIVGNDYSDGKLGNLITKLDLSKKVHLLGQLDNPFKVVSKCEAYVLSSLFEGFPNALVEAMALGRPVIAVNCQSGPKEILDDVAELEVQSVYQAKYGIIYKNYLTLNEDYSATINPEHQNLANAMELLYNDKELQELYHQQSLKRAKDFSYEVTKNKLVKILKF